jgi:hypothetical protein
VTGPSPRPLIPALEEEVSVVVGRSRLDVTEPTELEDPDPEYRERRHMASGCPPTQHHIDPLCAAR